MLRSAKKARVEIVKRNFRSPTKETNSSEKTQTPKSRRKWVTPTFDEKMKKNDFETPVMLKLPANKLQTPFQRKTTTKEPVSSTKPFCGSRKTCNLLLRFFVLFCFLFLRNPITLCFHHSLIVKYGCKIVWRKDM